MKILQQLQHWQTSARQQKGRKEGHSAYTSTEGSKATQDREFNPAQVLYILMTEQRKSTIRNADKCEVEFRSH